MENYNHPQNKTEFNKTKFRCINCKTNLKFGIIDLNFKKINNSFFKDIHDRPKIMNKFVTFYVNIDKNNVNVKKAWLNKDANMIYCKKCNLRLGIKKETNYEFESILLEWAK